MELNEGLQRAACLGDVPYRINSIEHNETER